MKGLSWPRLKFKKTIKEFRKNTYSPQINRKYHKRNDKKESK